MKRKLAWCIEETGCEQTKGRSYRDKKILDFPDFVYLSKTWNNISRNRGKQEGSPAAPLFVSRIHDKSAAVRAE